MSEIKLIFCLPVGLLKVCKGVEQDTHRRTRRVACSLFIGYFADNAVISAVTFFWGVDRWLIGI